MRVSGEWHPADGREEFDGSSMRKLFFFLNVWEISFSRLGQIYPWWVVVWTQVEKSGYKSHGALIAFHLNEKEIKLSSPHSVRSSRVRRYISSNSLDSPSSFFLVKTINSFCFILDRFASGVEFHFESHGPTPSHCPSRHLCHHYLCHHWIGTLLRKITYNLLRSWNRWESFFFFQILHREMFADCILFSRVDRVY